MKQAFREKLRLGPKNKEKLMVINEIIDEYAEEGYRLTLRQLYYQLVSRDIIPNQVKEYAKLSGLLVQGRMAGFVDWDAIEDRLRVPYLPYWVSDVPHAINDTIRQYRLNRQKDQEVYIEVWVEKDALSGVLKRTTEHFHINLMVNRGYSSCTAMHDAYERLLRYQRNGKKIVILYLGDHDPSGLDMIRDIQDRLSEFGTRPEVKHLGITRKQIEKYSPPPNPAKITDPRADKYIAEHGNISWEVDALTPSMLNQLIKKNVEKLIDMDLFNKQIEKEEEDKAKLREFMDEYGDE